MKKIISFLFIALVISGYCYSQNVSVTVRVTNIAVNGGKVYLAIFSNAESFRREAPEYAFELSANASAATHVVSLPPGDYVVSAFQDANNNQKVDYNIVGIPRELVGISNYSGQGFPSKNFDRQKIRIDSTTREITIGLYRF